jgi:hypothetical protein
MTARPALLTTLALAACAHSPFVAPLTPPDHGGAPWLVVTSRHFELHTDLSEARARDLDAELERIEAAFEDLTDFAFAQRPPPPGRVTVVAFARQADYLEVATSRNMPHSGALFTTEMHQLEPTPTIIMHGSLDSETRETLQHELTHRFIHFHLRDVPRWLDEGLAQYFSTLDLKEGYAYFGRLPKTLDAFFNPGARVGLGRNENIRFFTIEDLPPLAELLAAGPREFYAHDEKNTASTLALAYPAAFILVHFLSASSQHHADQLRQLIALLADAVPRADAWSRAFAGVAPAELERQYRQYALAMTRSGQNGANGDRWLTLERTKYEPRSRPLAGTRPVDETHPLDAADVRLLFVRLRQWTPKNLDGVSRELDALAAEYPSNGQVHFLRGLVQASLYHAFDKAERELRTAVTAQPKDARFWLGLVELRLQNEELKPPPARRLELLEEDVHNLARRAQSAGSLNEVGWYYALRNVPATGMPFAMRAVAADRTCAACFDTLALLQEESGMLDDAVASQQRACELLPEQANARAFVERLEAYKRAAASAASNGSK